MRIKSAFTGAASALLFLALVLSTQVGTSQGLDSNGTSSTLEEEEEERDPLSDLTFAEFKERYRRLIPYMTFYVASNYVNQQQASTGQNYGKKINNAPPPRRSQQQHTAPSIRAASPSRKGGNNHRSISQSQQKKFVPSVQYDPKDIGAENDYFMPVRYSPKINNYEDYSGTSYVLYQEQKPPVQAEITASSHERLAQKNNRYYARPLRPTGYGDFVPRKQSNKPPHTNPPEDYIVDYVVRPGVKTIGAATVNYSPLEEVGGPLRYIPPALSPFVQQTLKIVESMPSRQPPLIILPQAHRNPNPNLHSLAESYQLTEHLPEMLNKNNIDNSIKTLVEILNLLHNAKKEEFPQIPAPPASPSLPTSPAFRPVQKFSGYYAKPRPNTRPKVITESKFPTDPNPLIVPESPGRFKPTPVSPSSYDYDEIESKVPLRTTYDADGFQSTISHSNDLAVTPNVPQRPSYTIDEPNGKQVLEYYTPYAQDVPPESKETFRPTVKPHDQDIPTRHSYEITEDLSDDVSQNERFQLPHITESIAIHSSEEPNEIPTEEPDAQRNSLKYGATRGKPHVDYPAYASIPDTDFSCKEQRYKGFFGDPSTGCQVWHYCDLNGGKSSFLCPNGTIFSQVALTCDWWFNVKCESTTQLYVLNERLYKYILPIMPKFPEDFTGPEVDRYLEIKFKEMEAKLKEKKLKKQQERKEKAKNKVQPQNEQE